MHARLPPQALPHVPQFAALERVSVSQPFALLPSQLPNPVVHETTAHAPAVQLAVAFVRWHAAVAAAPSVTPSQSSSIPLQMSAPGVTSPTQSKNQTPGARHV